MEPCTKQAEIAKLQSEVDAIFGRIDEQLSLTKAVYELIAEVREISVKLQVITDSQQLLKKEVDELKSTPKKRWDGIVQTALGAVVGGFIAFILMQLGIK